ncbi:uncharacterized protein Dwil_GK19356 [Drosophila willistoni]|uniref:MD-2-related lipid-recognition domain-containing protein n=1 Tax=Drosophila willistoni TaxID=7260 RepID=B4N0M5_DROWI|nr:uncharacterized protein LOC6644252 [Drosophila willistoni]EDW77638.2 uncharacterized protein Dwil_GK19356 [Drosophila willistoni]
MRWIWFALFFFVGWKWTGIESKESCYYISFTYTNWTDAQPRFVVNMTFSNQSGIGSITTINEEIPMPVSRLLVLQIGGNQPRTIYNASTKLCELQSLFNSVPLFKPAKDNFLKQGNYSFSCPLPRGTYVMSNMRINPKNPLLSLLYQPKRSFIVRGGLFEELPSGRISPLSTYFMAGKVIKRSCGASD